MGQEIKDILISIQGTVIQIQQEQRKMGQRIANLEEGQEKLKQGQEELSQEVTGLKQGQEELRQEVTGLKQGQEELKQKIDRLEKRQDAMYREAVLPIKYNQNEINENLRKGIQEIKSELQSIKTSNYVQKVI